MDKVAPRSPGKARSASPRRESGLEVARVRAVKRPFEQAGALVKAQEAPRDPKALSEECEQQLCSHLRAVCSWPEQERNHSWRVGDYSFCVLSFSPGPEIEPYVQFWSEPDEHGAIFEVSSGAWHLPTKKYVDAKKQELLRDHGFEIGGNAGNFRKIVTIESPAELRAVAREALAVLCKVLRYDGTVNLDYKLCLASASVMGHVMARMSPDPFRKLLHEWGFAADVEVGKPHPTQIAVRTAHGPFIVQFSDETRKHSGWYQTLILSACWKVASREAVALARRINDTVPTVNRFVNKDGNFVIESRVLLYGGVTLEHLRTRVQLWSALMEEIAKARSATASTHHKSAKLIHTIFPRDVIDTQIADWINEQRRTYPPPAGRQH